MYTNPRLKHVKKIEEIADFLRLAGKPATAKMITNQCNLLLETKKRKKAEKKYLSDYAKLMFRDNKEITDVTCHYLGYANTYHRDGSITGGNTQVSYPKNNQAPIKGGDSCPSKDKPSESKPILPDPKEESKCECSCHEFGQVVHSGICKCGVMPETTSDAYDRKHPKEEMREIEIFNSFEIEDMADEALAVRLNKVIDRVNILSKRK